MTSEYAIWFGVLRLPIYLEFGTQFCMQIPLHFKPFLAKPIQVSGSLSLFSFIAFHRSGPVAFYICISGTNSVPFELGGHKTFERLFKAFGRPMKSSGHDFAEGEVCSWF